MFFRISKLPLPRRQKVRRLPTFWFPGYSPPPPKKKEQTWKAGWKFLVFQLSGLPPPLYAQLRKPAKDSRFPPLQVSEILGHPLLCAKRGRLEFPVF